MTVSVGTKIGPFAIGAPLGAGGMGEVYRARDTRLGRDVAIKVLPPEWVFDAHRRRRFEREARILASLNHPNIATLLGIEDAPTGPVLVMELVEGETLADRIGLRERVPLGESLSIARQVATALEAAHERGVIHRDLKASNIVVRPDGTAKVLDFGLAKTLEVPGDPGETLAATATLTGETAGLGPGTLAYMSPEQARGRAVDKRTDIWAFGCVLFELLTGQRPFPGDGSADVVAGILEREPDLTRLPPDTPAGIRLLLRRCFQKDPQQRLRDIGDARLELEDALLSPTADPARSTADRAAAIVPRLQKTLAAAALLFGIGVLGLGVRAWLTPQPSLPVVRTIIAADPFVSGTDRSLAFLPEGSRLAYTSRDGRHIFVRPLDALEPVTILKTAAYIRGVFPSPDGRWFAYIENAFTLKKVSATGGPPITVLTMDGPSRGAAWGPDDTIVFATAAPDTGLQRVASVGGPVTVLTRPNGEQGETDHVQPNWLPGGRSLLFTILSARGGLDAAKVAVLDLATGASRTLFEGGYAARYVESGYLVYVAAGALWATRFDLDRLETRGTPREVVRDIGIGTLGAAAEFDISSTGTLAYSRGTAIDRRIPVWIDGNGRETPLGAPPDNYYQPRLSPDGKRLAVGASPGDIYVWELNRPWSSASRITLSPGIDWYPVWTPDSRRIVFGSWRGGRFSNIYVHDLATSSTERLTDSPDMQSPTSITPDGTTVIFHDFPRRLQALRLHGPAEPVTLVDMAGEERNAEVSPDGRWLAYEGESSSRPGELDVYVRSFPDVNRGVWQVTRQGGMFPMWSRNGRTLFYVTFDGVMTSVPVEASSTTWKAGSPSELFHGPYTIRGGTYGRLFDVARDGRFLMLKDEPTAGTPHIVMVQNWVAELTRQAR